MRRLFAVALAVMAVGCGSEAGEICLDVAGVCVPEGTTRFCTQAAHADARPCPEGEHPATGWELAEWQGETVYRSSPTCVPDLDACY